MKKKTAKKTRAVAKVKPKVKAKKTVLVKSKSSLAVKAAAKIKRESKKERLKAEEIKQATHIETSDKYRELNPVQHGSGAWSSMNKNNRPSRKLVMKKPIHPLDHSS